jgi:hypothetical protein
MDENSFSKFPDSQRYIRSLAAHAAATALVLPALWPNDAAAQGLPVDTGSHVPVALWFIGAAVLGIVLAYGIIHNRKRTRAEVQRTEQATRDLYKDEGRDRARSGGEL